MIPACGVAEKRIFQQKRPGVALPAGPDARAARWLGRGRAGQTASQAVVVVATQRGPAALYAKRSRCGREQRNGQVVAHAHHQVMQLVAKVPIPVPVETWIERPLGVKYRAVVSLRPVVGLSGSMVCTEPLPNV